MSRLNCVYFQAGIKLHITMLYVIFITFDDISDFVSKSKLPKDSFAFINKININY